MDESSFEPFNLAQLNFVSQAGRTDTHDVHETSEERLPALPNEVPEPLNLKNVPSDILKSGTIDALISQNEDLMARIKVGLRRLSLVENENAKSLEEVRKLQAKNSSLTDQMLVLREKDDLWKQKNQSFENEVLKVKERAKLLEMDYAFVKAENSDLKKALGRHLKYRRSIKSGVRPWLRSLKREITQLWQQNHQLESKTLQKEALIKSLRDQILEISKNIKIQTKSYEVNQATLLEQIESQKAENLKLQSDFILLTEALSHEQKVAELMQNQNSDLQNRIITLERNLSDQEEQRTQEIQNLKKENQSFQSEIGYLKADLEAALHGKDEANLKCDREKSENNVMTTQLDHMRQMWEQKNQDNEKLKLKMVSLERINAELSLQLKEQRKKAEEVLAKTFEIKKNIVASESGLAQENKELTSHITHQNKAKLEKIERLLGEIQTSAHESKTP